MLLLFTACSKDSDNNSEPTTARRTVIVFISGDNTLSSFTNGDIQELVNGSYNTLSGDDRLVMYVDRISNNEKPFIARITGNSSHPVDTLFKYSEDFYSSEPKVFTEILSRIMKLCPAKVLSYGVMPADGASKRISVVPLALIMVTIRRMPTMDFGSASPICVPVSSS